MVGKVGKYEMGANFPKGMKKGVSDYEDLDLEGMRYNINASMVEVKHMDSFEPGNYSRERGKKEGRKGEIQTRGYSRDNLEDFNENGYY